MAAPEGDLVGQSLLGKLRVIRRIGEGATSVVYEVEHLLTKHRRALKVLRPELSRSGEAVARLVREAGAAGKIRSPFVAETFDVGRLPDGSTYVLSELVAGEPLRAILDREGKLPERRVVEIAMQLCEGLAAVHAAGIVHRDLKPENLLFDDRAEGRGALRIVDFGAMGLFAGPDTLGKLTSAGAIAGSPRYMAPEQIEGADVDARVDLYSAGVILFEALAGGRPFEEESAAALVRAITRGDAPKLAIVAPDVDAGLAAIVEKAMAHDREARFASAEEMQRALGSFAATHPTASSPFPPSSMLARKYDVVRCLKSGGMGAVYEVIHRETKRRCALKLMLPALLASEGARSRFAREARAAAKIASEHVVEVLDAGVDPESRTPYLVMELLHGEELASLVERRTSLAHAELIALLRQAATALDEAHAAGVVHRDLKPENLFVTTREDGTPRLKILDFGIAKVASESAGGATGGPIGTPAYMAPEQLEAGIPIGPAADLYALAHVAFTSLAGTPYFREEARAGLVPLFAKILAGAREPASERSARIGVAIPQAFDAWFAKATAVAPEDRFGSASEEVEALEEALRHANEGDARASLAPGQRKSWAGAVSGSETAAARAVSSSVPSAEVEAGRDRAPPKARPWRTAAFAAGGLVLVVAGVLAGRAGRPEGASVPVSGSVSAEGTGEAPRSSSAGVGTGPSPSGGVGTPPLQTVALDTPPLASGAVASASSVGAPTATSALTPSGLPTSGKTSHSLLPGVSPRPSASPPPTAPSAPPTTTRTRDSVF